MSRVRHVLNQYFINVDTTNCIILIALFIVGDEQFILFYILQTSKTIDTLKFYTIQFQFSFSCLKRSTISKFFEK